MNNHHQSLAEQVRQACDVLRTRRATLRNEREELSAERERLETAPLNKHDFTQFLCDYVDAKGSMFPESFADLRGSISYAASPKRDQHPNGPSSPISMRDADQTLAGSDSLFPEGIRLFTGKKGLPASSFLLDHAVYYFFGDLLKEKVSRYVADAVPEAANAGFPVQERRARIAAIEERISEIDVELSEVAVELAQFRQTSS